MKSTDQRSHMFLCKINLFVCLLWLSFSTFQSIIWSINYAMTMTNALHTDAHSRTYTALQWQQQKYFVRELFANLLPSSTRKQYTHTYQHTRCIPYTTHLMKWQKRCNRNCLQMFCQHLLCSRCFCTLVPFFSCLLAVAHVRAPPLSHPHPSS